MFESVYNAFQQYSNKFQVLARIVKPLTTNVPHIETSEQINWLVSVWEEYWSVNFKLQKWIFVDINNKIFSIPVANDVAKVNNKNTRTMCEWHQNDDNVVVLVSFFLTLNICNTCPLVFLSSALNMALGLFKHST